MKCRYYVCCFYFFWFRFALSYLVYGVFMKCFLFIFFTVIMCSINIVVLFEGRDFDGMLAPKEKGTLGFVGKKLLKGTCVG